MALCGSILEIFKSIFLPSFDWIQIEVSGLCKANCIYCPKTVWREKWEGKNLSLDTFISILPYFKKTKLVYLQGWGEPLNNPNFFEMVRLAKAQGAMVGFTTNGVLIDEDMAEKIVVYGVDIIAFSLAGIEMNDALRKGNSLSQVLNAVERINRAKERLKKSYPKVHSAYMLLKSNEHELERLPSFLSGLKISQVVVSLLDFIPKEDLKEECLAPKTIEEFNLFKSRAERVVEKAKTLGLKVVFNIPHPSFQRRICSENPVRSLFINSLGMVSPCVFTGIPARNTYFLNFGNIQEEELKKIWKKREYEEFRKVHSSQSKPDVCKVCPKSRVVEVGWI